MCNIIEQWTTCVIITLTCTQIIQVATWDDPYGRFLTWANDPIVKSWRTNFTGVGPNLYPCFHYDGGHYRHFVYPLNLRCGDRMFVYCSIDHLRQPNFFGPSSGYLPNSTGIVNSLHLTVEMPYGAQGVTVWDVYWNLTTNELKVNLDTQDFEVRRGNETGEERFRYIVLIVKLEGIMVDLLQGNYASCDATYTLGEPRNATIGCSASHDIKINTTKCVGPKVFPPCFTEFESLPGVPKWRPLMAVLGSCSAVVFITVIVVGSCTRDDKHHIPSIIKYLPDSLNPNRKKSVETASSTGTGYTAEGTATASTATFSFGKQSNKSDGLNSQSVGFVRSLIDFKSMKDLEANYRAAVAGEGSVASTGKSGKSGNSQKTVTFSSISGVSKTTDTPSRKKGKT